MSSATAIYIGNEQFENVNFIYLETGIEADATTNPQIRRRCVKLNVMCHLRTIHGFSLKLRVLKIIVFPKTMYRCEARTVTLTDESSINASEMRKY